MINPYTFNSDQKRAAQNLMGGKNNDIYLDFIYNLESMRIIDELVKKRHEHVKNNYITPKDDLPIPKDMSIRFNELLQSTVNNFDYEGLHPEIRFKSKGVYSSFQKFINFDRFFVGKGPLIENSQRRIIFENQKLIYFHVLCNWRRKDNYSPTEIEKDSTDFSYNYSISVDLAAFILRFVSFINIDFNVLPLISMDANIML